MSDEPCCREVFVLGGACRASDCVVGPLGGGEFVFDEPCCRVSDCIGASGLGLESDKYA